MFDINFYEAVTRFVDLNDKIKQNPKELIPSKASCGRSNVYTKFSENIKKYEHTLHHKLAFKYYMKIYFNYFDMSLPDASNK
jgi:hypothetical protein